MHPDNIMKLFNLLGLIVVLSWFIFFPNPLVLSATQTSGTTERISVSTSGEQANGESYNPSISEDGRFVAFQSNASNLVSEDTNNASDVFVYDRQNKILEIVSISSSGVIGNDYSNVPSISPDGRFVAFKSGATNLVTDDTNEKADIFIHDRQSGMTERISVSSDGEESNGSNYLPSVSKDGNFIAFLSWASNLVSDDTNGNFDIFVRDRQNGITERVSISSAGEEGNDASDYPSISDDGRFIAFESSASNLVSGDMNEKDDIFVHDRQNRITELISISSNNESGNEVSWFPSISFDGRYVAFSSYSSNLVSGDTNGKQDIFIRDRHLGVTELISLSSNGEQGNEKSVYPSVSNDGNFVTFSSDASNLVIDDLNNGEDIFIRDRQKQTTELISISSADEYGNSDSYDPSISMDGRFVAFYSFASNLVDNDTNSDHDIFVRDRCPDGSCGAGTITKKLKLLFVPLNWIDSQIAFDSEAHTQANLFVDEIPLNNCRDQVLIKTLDVQSQNYDSFTCSANNCAVNTVKTFLENDLNINTAEYDVIVGMAEESPCPPIMGCSNGTDTIWVAEEYDIVTAHELGHIYDLEDEYCSNQAGSTDERCNDGDSQGDGSTTGDINWLDRSLPCDCPANGDNDSSESPCCNFDGHDCSSINYGVCCLGNKNSAGGRSTMSYANAPGPRGFDLHDMEHLSSLEALNCDPQMENTQLFQESVQNILDINLVIHPDDSVIEENISITSGRQTPDTVLQGMSGSYTILIVNDNSDPIWSQDFEIYFDYYGPVVLDVDYSSISYDEMGISFRILHSNEMYMLKIFHNDELIYLKELPILYSNYIPLLLRSQ